MPLDIVHKMKKQLRKAIKYRDYRISNVFFKVTTKLFGGYRSAIILQTNGKLLWDSETFIKSTTKHWQKYVRIVIATQLFQQVDIITNRENLTHINGRIFCSLSIIDYK